MRSVFIALLLLIYSAAKAQPGYEASLIPKELLPYASAVVRDEETTVEVEDLDNVVVHFKSAVTVLNKNGNRFATIAIAYNKSAVIKYLKGVIYNEFGKPLSKFSERDFEDQSNAHDYSLFEDERVKIYDPPQTDYPYTIVYEYDQRYKQSLTLPSWQPNPHKGVAVEKSVFIFTCKPDFNIRYKETNITKKVDISTNSKGLKTYSWSANGLKAVKDEPYSPYEDDYLSGVQLSPEKFKYFGLTGSYTSWKELGKWQYEKLVANRQTLPQETIDHVKEIIKDIPSPKLKAKKIYEYMQGKTHYISVQVGIGGFQPFPATEVDQQGYGDCKALVNYTQALLKAVDIESYYCIVQADDDYNVSLLKDFPSMEQGNHIILCLPFKNDTTWADCTSQTLPFGYLGAFTDDRVVLACTPEGGKLMHTPKYTPEVNLKSRKAFFLIDPAGELTGSITTVFKGVDYELRDELINEPKSKQDKLLKELYPINNMLIESLAITQDKSFDPSTTENVRLKAPDYASFTDGKYFFMLNPIYRSDWVPKTVRNRSNPVYINRGYTDVDEITYTVPSGYRLEKEPLNVSIDKPFGKFSVTMELKDDQLVYKRKFQLIDGTYSKDTYDDFVDFCQSVADADDYSVTLIKGT